MSTSPNPTYNHLTTLLHPPSPPSTPLEISILPPSHATQILTAPSSPPSIGIPPKLLLACFLLARRIYLHEDADGKEDGEGCRREEEVLQATKILTLWEPNWGSAWAWRRRWLRGVGGLRVRNDGEGAELFSGRQTGCTATAEDENHRKANMKNAVEEELWWVETLVRSPLCGKHAKSSWVWAHRGWVVREFATEVLRVGYAGEAGGEAAAFVKRELEIVMVAGERHARNYHAWQYARQVVRMAGGRLGPEAWVEAVGMVHRWCLMHPRDISGWAFLVFILDQAVDVDRVARDVFRKTREFVEKFRWKGESIEWFLKSASHFQIDGNDD